MRGEFEYLIIYDDRVPDEARNRWSIGHELGHAFCGHLIEFELTSMFRSGLSAAEYGVLEVEAHFFASELFAPTPVLRLLNTFLYTEKICVLCDISVKAARRKANRLKDRSHDSEFTNYQLLFNFCGFIFSKNYLRSIYKTMLRQLEAAPWLFWDKYEVCRVCPTCGAFIDGSGYPRCHICGTLMETPRCNGRRYPSIEDISFPDGKLYQAFEEDNNLRALFCPVCNNSNINRKDEYCHVCNTPLYNRCLEEGTIVSLKCRRCPWCGGQTVYSEIYDAVGDIRIPRPSRFKDYDMYAWWGFVRYMFRISGEMELYAILADSVVYTDDDHFVLVFAGDKRYRQKLLSSLRLIAEYLGTYGLARVEGIRLYHFDRVSKQIYWITAKDEEKPFTDKNEFILIH